MFWNDWDCAYDGSRDMARDVDIGGDIHFECIAVVTIIMLALIVITPIHIGECDNNDAVDANAIMANIASN